MAKSGKSGVLGPATAARLSALILIFAIGLVASCGRIGHKSESATSGMAFQGYADGVPAPPPQAPNESYAQNFNSPTRNSGSYGNPNAPAADDYSGGGGGGSANVPSEPSTAKLEWMAAAQAADMQAMMVYNADVQLTVKKGDEAAKTVLQMVTAKGGYISGQSQQGKEESLTISLTVKLPSKELFNFLDSLSKVGDIESKNVTGQDVGQEYFDLKARKDSLEMSYARLKDLLSKAGKLPDLLSIEQEVTSTEEQLNQVNGRMKQLENYVAFSTVTITMSVEPKPDVFDQPKFSWLTKTAFSEYWGGFLVFARGLWHVLLFLAAFSPVWLIALILIVIAIKSRKRKVAPSP